MDFSKLSEFVSQNIPMIMMFGGIIVFMIYNHFDSKKKEEVYKKIRSAINAAPLGSTVLFDSNYVGIITGIEDIDGNVIFTVTSGGSSMRMLSTNVQKVIS